MSARLFDSCRSTHSTRKTELRTPLTRNTSNRFSARFILTPSEQERGVGFGHFFPFKIIADRPELNRLNNIRAFLPGLACNITLDYDAPSTPPHQNRPSLARFDRLFTQRSPGSGKQHKPFSRQKRT
jgi:hypothetical protein